MDIKKFAKDHKKELIIGGVVIVGVTAIAISAKTKKPVPVNTVVPFSKVAADTVAQWEANGCRTMYVSAGLLKDLDKYAKYLQDSFPEAMDKGIELIIGFAPDNKLMHVRSAATEIVKLA